MADERYSFAQARTRLEEIVVQVRKKDTSLEKSLDLLEEGVRLANVCTELSDHTEWRAVAEEQRAGVESGGEEGETIEGATRDEAPDSGEPGSDPVVDRSEAPDGTSPSDGAPSAE